MRNPKIENWVPPVFNIENNILDILDPYFYNGRQITCDSYPVESIDGSLCIFDSEHIIPINKISKFPQYRVVFIKGRPHYADNTVYYSYAGKEYELPRSLVITNNSPDVSKVIKEVAEQTAQETLSKFPQVKDPINPDYYKRLPFEVINITENYNFCIGNALKYLMRAGFKPGNSASQDLRKAKWYLDREISSHRPEPPLYHGDTFEVAHQFPGPVGSIIYQILNSNLCIAQSLLEKHIEQCKDK